MQPLFFAILLGWVFCT